ncbi:MAG: exodeoxyribonuclease I [Burkholderiales bacterium]|nr:exodeoxyribonuclease I [Burkholderiales bacterium]
MRNHTFLWHDYETFGVNPRRDRPAQFAAIRTNAALEEVGEPMMLYCQPAPDFLPDPQSCLITGITPQECLQKGIPEYQFAQQIEQALGASGTIGVGYNTIRFDDEVTRFMFWRNLIDPYAREWQNQCGRWDLLDVVRTAHALRPEGIQWPLNDEGKPSFRLEHLTAANGIAHTSAHDALSDVRATIGIARLIQQHQPKLFDFCLDLHKKERVAQEIGLHLPQPERKPFLHISGMFGVERGCTAIVWPLAQHPTNKNEVIVWDCAFDPEELFSLGSDSAAIALRLFSKASDLPEGVLRLPIKTIHLNKSPMVIGNLKTLSPARAEHWGIDVAANLTNAAKAAQGPDMRAVWEEVFGRQDFATVDVDEDLYGGFIGSEDRKQLNQLRQFSPEKLAGARCHFHDPRLEELLFRYRARNFPTTLDEEEQERWFAHCADRLLEGVGGVRNVDTFLAELDQLQAQATEEQLPILEMLAEYAEMIIPS